MAVTPASAQNRTGQIRGEHDPEQAVQAYLARLQLNAVLTRQLERMIELPGRKTQRQSDVKSLTDLYVRRLLESGDDPGQRDQLIVGVNRLLRNHPNANTTALQVMLLQADYAVAETATGKWLDNSEDSKSFSEAEEIVLRITPDLQSHLADLKVKIDQANKRLDAATTEKQLAIIETELSKLYQVNGRAQFYLAWSLYYKGVLRPKAVNASGLFQQSRDLFRNFLKIEGDYADTNADEIDLQSPALARAMIGLAQAEIGAGSLLNAEAVLQVLADSQAPLELRQQQGFWYLQGLVNAQLYAEATDFVRKAVVSKGEHDPASMLAISVRSAIAGLSRSQHSSNAKSLGFAGVSGLVNFGRIEIAIQLLEKYEVPIENPNDFYLMWMSGQQHMQAAEKLKDVARFSKAAELFQSAMKQPEAQQDRKSASRCQYQLAYCQFQMGDHLVAAKNYASMINTLTSIDREMAANAAWMAFVGYQKSLKNNPDSRVKAITMLETLKRSFPESPHASKTDYQISLLQRGSETSAKSMAKLDAIEPDSDDYRSSRYDLVLMVHKQWSAAGPDKRDQLTAKQLGYVDAFLKASHSSAEPKRKLKCVLIASDVLLNGPTPDLPAAQKYLLLANTITKQHKDLGDSASEFRYRMMQFGLEKGDRAFALKYAKWLQDNSSGSPYEIPALVHLAQNLTDNDPQEGYQIFQRLTSLLGKDQETLLANKNAKISMFQFAKYAHATGKFDEAATAIERVLKTDPKNKTYLKLAGQSYYKSGKFGLAVPIYRTLVRGLKTNSDEWYAAKYFHVDSLLKTDAKKGQQVLKQFQLMHKDLPATWNAKFLQLNNVE